MLTMLLVPALLQSPSLPNATEARPGFFILRGAPDGSFGAMRGLGITHVLNLRMDAEGDFAPAAAAAQGEGLAYDRCPMGGEPSDAALDAFRARLKALPGDAKVLLHCASGNRVSGAAFAYWVLDLNLPEAEALELARKSGLKNPATEAAVRKYVAAKRK